MVLPGGCSSAAKKRWVGGSASLAVGSRALLAVGLSMEAGPGVCGAVLLGGRGVTTGEGLGAGLCWQVAVVRCCSWLGKNPYSGVSGAVLSGGSSCAVKNRWVGAVIHWQLVVGRY